jgi:hypothetical protein
MCIPRSRKSLAAVEIRDLSSLTHTGNPERHHRAFCRGVLAKINSYSTKNRFALALKELGNVIRTTYLLEWIMDELRRTVHKGTTKIERHHKFAQHLAFGAGGHLRSNDPGDQEKANVYNEPVTNAVALHMLRAEGVSIRLADLAFLSPYATSKLKRFGDYPTDLKPEGMPTRMTLPL